MTSEPGLHPRRPEWSRRFQSTEQEAYLRLMRVQDGLAREFNALFKRHGLSQPGYNVLRIVQGAGAEGIRSQSICDHMIQRDPDVTRLVDRLCKAGWVSRHRSELDRRVIRIRISEAGRRKLAELEPEVTALHSRQLGLCELLAEVEASRDVA